MTDRTDEMQRFPRTVLLSAAVLAFGVITVIALSRTADVGVSRIAYTTPLQTRALRFTDQPDGAVAVFAASDNQRIAVLEPGHGGFVRIVMRALAKERLAKGVGSGPAFELTRWDDGRLSITDPETGRRLDLSGFGKTNVDDFAKLLLAGRATS